MAATHQQYHNLFRVSPNGQAVLEDMMRAHHFYSSTFVSGDPQATAFNEGERNAVLRILTFLDEFEKGVPQNG